MRRGAGRGPHRRGRETHVPETGRAAPETERARLQPHPVGGLPPHQLHREGTGPAALRRRGRGIGADEQRGEERAGEGVTGARGVPGPRRRGGHSGEHGAGPRHQRAVPAQLGHHQRDMAAQLGRRVRGIGQPRQQARLVPTGQQDIQPLRELQEAVHPQAPEKAGRRRIQTDRDTTRACGVQRNCRECPARRGEQQIAGQMQPGDPVERRVGPVGRFEPERGTAVREEGALGRGPRIDQADHRPGRGGVVQHEPWAHPGRQQLTLVPRRRVRAHPPEQPYVRTARVSRPAGHVGAGAAGQRPDRGGRVGTGGERAPVPGDDIGDDVAHDQQRPGPARRHLRAHAAATRAASRTLPRTAARLALSDAPSVCRTR
ncbi:hypothetical protein GCM10010121_041780 [Streptomyces brasiliensis]|uniref:Uncharacterized protein n=1 Tax=Streptomyces brasiliensis TaxID=1954 RepID=A0A917NTG2_9ACTN|nr:hypothetical protein GCM10010121_041780 [Streptomyces brasiliensis]